MVLFVIFTFFSSIMEGSGGLNATKLNGAVTSAGVTLTVDSTVGFMTADVVIIGDEEIAYTGTTAVSFTGCTRGYNSTLAVDHTDNSQVYSPSSGVLNRALGFNVSSTGATAGTFAVITMTWNFLVKAVPNLIMWNYSFLEGQLVYVRYLLMAIGVGLVLYYGFAAINAAMGILKR